MTAMQATPAQRATLEAADDGKPIAIVNLLKFREQASYPEGSAEANLALSGREAYRCYVQGFLALIAEFGGKQLYWGDSRGCMIGEGEWDAVWINRFPSVAQVSAATVDPRYAELKRHRKAGLAWQHALLTRPEDAGG